MNTGLVFSFIIAGTLMISIVTMNLRLSGSSTELTMSQITREHTAVVTEMLNDDLPNMGYDINTKTDPILTHADSTRIQFYRNVYRDPNRQPELITWELTDQTVPGSDNPEHRTLIRVERDAATGLNDTTRIQNGVTGFRLRYYSDQHGKDLDMNMDPPPGSDPAALATIRQIYLELELQSSEVVVTRPGSPGRFIRSVYEKRYSPGNLE